MSFSTPGSIVSARPYPIVLVDDAPPAGLAAVADANRFTVDLDGSTYVVRGCGRVVDDRVRFHEKDVANSGKDIRVWTVAAHDDGSLTAEHAAAF